jgi:hypothetical protein
MLSFDTPSPKQGTLTFPTSSPDSPHPLRPSRLFNNSPADLPMARALQFADEQDVATTTFWVGPDSPVPLDAIMNASGESPERAPRRARRRTLNSSPDQSPERRVDQYARHGSPESPLAYTPPLAPPSPLGLSFGGSPPRQRSAPKSAPAAPLAPTKTASGTRYTQAPSVAPRPVKLPCFKEDALQMIVNGVTYDYTRVGHGAQHYVISLTGHQLITWQTTSGPVSFWSDEVVIKYPMATHPVDVQRQLSADVACLKLYQGRGLATPHIYIYPDIESATPQAFTFVDSHNPRSGGFFVIEKVQGGFNTDTVRNVNRFGKRPKSMAAIPDAATRELMQFALGQWTNFVRFMAEHAEPPYTQDNADGGVSSLFKANSALWHDFTPGNVGRDRKGFLHLDGLVPKLSSNSLLYKSLYAFMGYNQVIFDEVVNILLNDPELKRILGTPERLLDFQTALRALFKQASREGRST